MIVPDVPMTRSNPARAICPRYLPISASMWRTSLRSSRDWSGSSFTKRSVRRMTPSLKLRPASIAAPVPRVTSTLPPPMSMTTATSPGTLTPYTAARWISRASSVPEITRGRMPVCWVTACRNSPPFSASRVALVATAITSSTLWDSAKRLNFEST